MPDQPPKKRLKLNVRPPNPRSIQSNHSNHSNDSAQSDTIVVSTRPRRSVTLNKRYSTQASDDEEINDGDTTSDLSSAPPSPSVEDEPSSQTSKPLASAKRDYGAMFMATYLEGGVEDADEAEEKEEEEAAATTTADGRTNELPVSKPPAHSEVPPSVHTNTAAAAPSILPVVSHKRPSVSTHTVATVRSSSSQLPQQYGGSSVNVQRPSNPQFHDRPTNHPWHQPSAGLQYHAPQFQRPYPPPPIELPEDPTKHASVNEMVKRLKTLHKELAQLRGAPPPESSSDSEDDEEKENPLDDHNPLNPFLALFEDNASESSDEEVQRPAGEPDHALVFGVNFIMNAVRSFASGRIEMIYTNQTRHHFQLLQEWDAKRRPGPGRPKKVADEHLPPPPPPPPIRLDAIGQYDLTGHPEAAVIAAFAEVIRSGALQLNTLIPRPLARALRKLYKQIDQVINAGPRQHQEWRMFSYHAQIQAHAELVENMKIQQLQAQQLMAQSQMDNERKIMQNMGLAYHHSASPNTLPGPGAAALTKEQDEWQRRVEIERKRNSQHARAQPYLHQQHLHPMQFRTFDSPTGQGSATSMMPGAPIPAPPSGVQHMSQPNGNGPPAIPQRPPTNPAGPSAMQALAQAHFSNAWNPAFVGPIRHGSNAAHPSSYHASAAGSLNRGETTIQQSASRVPGLPPNSPSDPITISSSPVPKRDANGSKKMSEADAGLLGALGIMPEGKPAATSTVAANARPAPRTNAATPHLNGRRRSSGVSTVETAVALSEKRRGKRKAAEVIEISDSS